MVRGSLGIPIYNSILFIIHTTTQGRTQKCNALLLGRIQKCNKLLLRDGSINVTNGADIFNITHPKHELFVVHKCSSENMWFIRSGENCTPLKLYFENGNG